MRQAARRIDSAPVRGRRATDREGPQLDELTVNQMLDQTHADGQVGDPSRGIALAVLGGSVIWALILGAAALL
jgi:hypothetical protein